MPDCASLLMRRPAVSRNSYQASGYPHAIEVDQNPRARSAKLRGLPQALFDKLPCEFVAFVTSIIIVTAGAHYARPSFKQRNSLFGVSAMFVPFPIWRSCFVVPWCWLEASGCRPTAVPPCNLVMKAKTCDENEINYYRTSSDCSCRGSKPKWWTGVCGSPIGITTGAGGSGRKATSEWTESGYL